MFTPGHRTRVQVHHADAVVSAGLRFALQTQSSIELCDGLPPGADVLICDYTAAVERASAGPADAAAKPVRVLVLTEQDREQAIRHALQSGVHGYVLCSTDIETLMAAIRAVAQGHRFLSPEIAERLDGSARHDALTPREEQVLQLLAEGHANKEVASLLGIGPGTVKTHVAALMGKLGATSRMAAVSLAAQRGLVSFDRCSPG